MAASAIFVIYLTVSAIFVTYLAASAVCNIPRCIRHVCNIPSRIRCICNIPGCIHHICNIPSSQLTFIYISNGVFQKFPTMIHSVDFILESYFFFPLQKLIAEGTILKGWNASLDGLGPLSHKQNAQQGAVYLTSLHFQRKRSVFSVD